MNAHTTISGGFITPSPTFDPKGNTLTLPRSNGTSQTLTWDAHDRLRSVTPSGSTASTMVYDPLGRLVWSRRPNSMNPPIDEVWSWSNWTLLAREVYQASTLLETYRYTWGPDLSGTLEGAGGVGGLLAVERAVGSSTTWDIRHAHADANGNILALTTSTGQVSARYRYSPFGETLTSQDLDSSGWATKNIHRFSTKPEIAGTGLLYYGYRYYDPQTGRWPSRDPIEERGGLNLYRFVGDSPVNNYDVLGERACTASEVTKAKAECASTGEIYVRCSVISIPLFLGCSVDIARAVCKKKKPEKCTDRTWKVGNCGRNGPVVAGCPGQSPFAEGATRQAAQSASLAMLPAGCHGTGGASYHHCTAHECVKGKWEMRM